MSWLFAIWFLLVMASYIHDDNLREYCIHVPTSEYHHIRVSENNACLIDWWYFVREPIFMGAVIYAAVIGPFLLLKNLLRKIYKFEK